MLLLIVGAGYGLWQSNPPLARRAPPPKATTPPQRHVTLFFATMDGSGLGKEIRNLPPCPDQAACLRDLVMALLAGPGPGLAPLFPQGGRLHAINLQDATAVVDFSQETILRLRGGALSEYLCLTGLANTLAVNFPSIRQIQILVDGATVTTLKGHVDLREPFPANFELVRDNAPSHVAPETGVKL